MLSGRRRLLAIGAWFVCSVVVWNVAFDRGVRSAEDRYLHAHAASPPPGGIRAVMEPAIEQSALVATLWASGVLVAGGLVWFGLRGRRPNAPR